MKGCFGDRCSKGIVLTMVVWGIALASIVPVRAAEEEQVKGIWIRRIHICRGINEREPVETGKSFPKDVKQLFCFTDVRDAGEETFITHSWYHEDELKASVKLKAAGTHWRTWSSKWIPPSWTGNWRVEINDATGRKIASIEFVVGVDSPGETEGSEG